MEKFFPDDLPTGSREYIRVTAEAFSYCDRCPVRIDCLRAGIDPIDPSAEHGIAGRLTGHIRRSYRLGRRVMVNS